jgi:hypothetical protein
MLLTDGNPNDTIALVRYEMEILNLAATEGIDLDQKLGLATEEISQDVLEFLLDHTRMVDPLPNVRRTTGVTDVVVSPQMTRWHALHTLAIVYRDAFNNQLNDRYQPKWREYELLAKDGATRTFSYGIGLVSNPIPEAETPSLGTASGAGLGGTFYVQVTWVGADGAEGAPSVATALTVEVLNDLVVQGVNPPAVATGFNVYAGTSANATTLQNSATISIGETYTVPDGGLIVGKPVGIGQAADTYITGGPMLRRG